MNADIVEMVGRARLDRLLQKTDIEVGDAHSDLRGRISFLGRYECLPDQIRIECGRSIHGEAAVEFVPYFPVFDIPAITLDHTANVIAPVLHILDGKLAGPAIRGGPSREIGKGVNQMNTIRLR